MPTPIQLLVGLANPGNEYAKTRHNAGAWAITDIAARTHATLRPETKYHGFYAKTSIDHQPCQLLIPTTFMNLSGRAVSACMRYQKIMPNELLVMHDDIDLPVGTIKLKFDGGDGGHNGLKDIISHLNTRQFYRLRIGVGRPRQHQDAADYVLDLPSRADREKIDAAISSAYDVLPTILSGEIQKAMQLLHTESPEK